MHTESCTCPACTAFGEMVAGYCTRCHRENTDARDVYFPISDEHIRLCTDCEPHDMAISPFELWHYDGCACPFCNQPTDAHAGDCETVN